MWSWNWLEFVFVFASMFVFQLTGTFDPSCLQFFTMLLTADTIFWEHMDEAHWLIIQWIFSLTNELRPLKKADIMLNKCWTWSEKWCVCLLQRFNIVTATKQPNLRWKCQNYTRFGFLSWKLCIFYEGQSWRFGLFQRKTIGTTVISGVYRRQKMAAKSLV